MREIKFRGLRVPSGQWIYGYVVDAHNEYCVIWPPKETRIPVDPKTVGQSTGLYDKSRKEIYEGDIVKGLGNKLGKVVYNAPTFTAKIIVGKETHYVSWPSEWFQVCEVIGNIHENPELLG